LEPGSSARSKFIQQSLKFGLGFVTAECIFRIVRSPFYFLAPLRRGLFSDRASRFGDGTDRLKQLLQPIHQRDERNKNGRDPIAPAKFNNMMRRARRPMLTIRPQEDDLLGVINGSASIPIGNLLLERHESLSGLARRDETIAHPTGGFLAARIPPPASR